MRDEAIDVMVVPATPDSLAQLQDLLRGDGRVRLLPSHKSLSDVVEEIGVHKPGLVLLEATVDGTPLQEAVERIMGYAPRPVLVLGDAQTLTSERAAAIKQRGALATMSPDDVRADVEAFVQNLLLLASVPVVRHLQAARRARWHPDAPILHPPGLLHTPQRSLPIVALVASTGGPNALANVLSGFSPDLPACIVIVQHLAAGFADHLVSWLDHVSPLDVALARSNNVLSAGQVRVAPNDKHLVLSSQTNWTLSDAPAFMGHRPSATVLLNSIAQVAPTRCIAVVLSGMGEDGAAGMVSLRRAGGHTLAQDERTSVIYGMAKRAVEMGGVQRELPLDQLPREITRLVHQLSSASQAPGALP